MPKVKKEQPKNDFFTAFIKSEMDLIFEKEFKFLENRRFRFDYANHKYKIVIEKEGGIWRKGGGAHSRPSGIERDIEKYTLAAVEGWIIIRRQPKQMLTIQTISLIRKAIESRKN